MKNILLQIAAFMLLTQSEIAQAQFINGQKANAVLGDDTFTPGEFTLEASATKFATPCDIAIDPVTEKVFVSDFEHNRVLRFSSSAAATNGGAAEAVFGQPNLETKNIGPGPAEMYLPRGVAFANGFLWVADTGNNRVLRFDNAATAPSGATASLVLGQPGFTTPPNSPSTTASGMSAPYGVAVDFFGTLWVADRSNSRVLRFGNAETTINGASADAVLGQPNFTTGSGSTTQSTMWAPCAVYAERTGLYPLFTTRLWVVDQNNNRVLRFDYAYNKANGGPADGVLGQLDFTSKSPSTSDSRVKQPSGIDGMNGNLWVADGANSRVLCFEDAANKGNGAPADTVLGRADFSDSPVGTDAADFGSQITGIGIDPAGNIYVADAYSQVTNNRVLRFSPGNGQPDSIIGRSAGQRRGNDIYNASSNGQKIRSSFRRKRGSKFYFRVGSDGPYADDVLIRGSRGGKFRVRYYHLAGGKKNATAKFLGNGYAHEAPYLGESLFRIEVKPKGRFQDRRVRRTFPITTRSTITNAVDRVKAKLIYKPR